MQEIPGYGNVRSDNPIVAEVLRDASADLFGAGETRRDTLIEASHAGQLTEEDAQAIVDGSELIARLGGKELLDDFAEELVGNVHPLEILIGGPAQLYAIFMTGLTVGALLAERAAKAPVIE